MTIPREPIDAEPLDLWREHRGEDLRSVGREALAGVLEETGVELGTHDARIAAWAGDWELSTVTTIASWLVRAYDAGRRAAAPDQPRPRVDVDEPDQYVAIGENVLAPLPRVEPDQPAAAVDEPDQPGDGLLVREMSVAWSCTACGVIYPGERRADRRCDECRTSPSDQPAAAVDEPEQPHIESADIDTLKAAPRATVIGQAASIGDMPMWALHHYQYGQYAGGSLARGDELAAWLADLTKAGHVIGLDWEIRYQETPAAWPFGAHRTSSGMDEEYLANELADALEAESPD